VSGGVAGICVFCGAIFCEKNAGKSVFLKKNVVVFWLKFLSI
jgi:hypothetical protein